MAIKKYYTIKVGRFDGQEVEIGHVDKLGIPKGPTAKAIAPPGNSVIPNYSRIWGKRELTKEGKPSGKFKPMAWGDDGGEVIEIRYLKKCKSLDKLYQDLNGIKPGEEDADIDLMHGLFDIDPEIEPMLVEMLKLHSYNEDSPCKDPSQVFSVYHEYDEKKEATLVIKKDKTLVNAMNQVFEAEENTEQLRVLAKVCGLDDRKQNNVLLTELLMLAKNQPEKFLENRAWYQQQVQNVLLRGVDFGLLDLEAYGKINLLTSSGGTVVPNIPQNIKPEKKLEYVIENAFDPAIFDGIERIKEAINEKELALA